jgi:glyoxylase-like metal-dependent hydrolase (beta-lactamase superfamily II)
MTKALSFLAAITLVAAVPSLAQRGPAAPAAGPLVRENATEKISDHVYVIPDFNVAQVPNVGIVVGTRGTLVIDTGLGARNGQAIVREMQKVSKTPELYLATTHFHPEHDMGAGGFPANTRMIRSNDQQKEIAADGAATKTRFMGFSPLHAELLETAEYRKADISFDKEHVLDLGGVRVRMIAMGYNHTRGDTAFFVEPDGVLFSGDVVMPVLPNVGNSTFGQWLASMDLFDKLQPKRIVPSHGAMGDLSMVANYRRFLQTVQQRAGELKKQGKTADETVATLSAELASAYPNGGARLQGSIRAAYTQAP